MATAVPPIQSLLNTPGLGFGTPFSSMADQRRKVGGLNLSLHPRRVAQRKAKEEQEDRELAKENRQIQIDHQKAQLDLQKQALALRQYQLGLGAAGGVPGLGGGASGLGGSGFGAAPAPLPVSPMPLLTTPPPSTGIGGGEFGFQAAMNPDGTIGFMQPTSPAPYVPEVVEPVEAVVEPVNPYMGMANPGAAPVVGGSAADRFTDMGLRQSAAGSQAWANARAAVAALKAQQEAQNPDPWTRTQVDGTAVAATPGATISTAPTGNKSLVSEYGTGSATFGQPVAKSFTTVGADGKTYTAPTFEKWKQDQIGERAIGRSMGADADIAAAGVAGSKAQGQRAFLDQLELIHQQSLKKKA